MPDKNTHLCNTYNFSYIFYGQDACNVFFTRVNNMIEIQSISFTPEQLSRLPFININHLYTGIYKAADNIFKTQKH
jgi:hypothetical protein